MFFKFVYVVLFRCYNDNLFIKFLRVQLVLLMFVFCLVVISDSPAYTECFFFTEIAYNWPVLLGGQAHWAVGLVATLISISSIIAADTSAFLCGRVCSLITSGFLSPVLSSWFVWVVV
jgi:CDP-diglyceride synthetase